MKLEQKITFALGWLPPMLALLLMVWAGDYIGVGLLYPLALYAVEREMYWLYTAIRYALSIGQWLILVIWLLIFKRNRPILRCFGREAKGNRVPQFLVGLGIGLGANLLCALVAIAHGDIQLHLATFQPGALLLTLLAVFIQSSSEEALCRGYLYQKLMQRYHSPAAAILLNSSLFAAIHLQNDGITALSMLNIILFGVVASLLVYYTDSIWCAFAFHTGWNYCQGILLGLPNSGNVVPFSLFKLDTAAAHSSLFYDATFGIEGGLTSVVIGALVGVGIYLHAKKHPIRPLDVWTEVTEPIPTETEALAQDK